MPKGVDVADGGFEGGRGGETEAGAEVGVGAGGLFFGAEQGGGGEEAADGVPVIGMEGGGLFEVVNGDAGLFSLGVGPSVELCKESPVGFRGGGIDALTEGIGTPRRTETEGAPADEGVLRRCFAAVNGGRYRGSPSTTPCQETKGVAARAASATVLPRTSAV